MGEQWKVWYTVEHWAYPTHDDLADGSNIFQYNILQSLSILCQTPNGIT